MKKTMRLQKVLIAQLELMNGRLKPISLLLGPNKYSESNF
jgi:hypothetical protein